MSECTSFSEPPTKSPNKHTKNDTIVINQNLEQMNSHIATNSIGK